MLLATNATRAFGINGAGELTARQAFAAAGDGDRLTLEGMAIRAESLPDVLALAQSRVSVVAVRVHLEQRATGEEPGATTQMSCVPEPVEVMSTATDTQARGQLGLW
jgi:hypothetical protein